MFKAIFIDLDDTLYPEKDFVFSGFKKVSEFLALKYKISFSKILYFLQTNFRRGKRKKLFNRLLKKFGLPSSELNRLVAIYRFHYPAIKPYAGVLKTLSYFSKIKKYKLVLISDGYKKTQNNKIKALKIKKYFNFVIINDLKNKKYLKPHPKSFFLAMKKTKTKPSEIVYIGDNPMKEFIVPKKIGIFTIRIKTGVGIYDKIQIKKKNEADVVLDRWIKIKKTLEKYEKKY